MNQSYKISVIIPIYGVESFIARCAETLLRQTLNEVEYIFVDDCTKDNSINVLKEVLSRFPKRKEHVQIIHHEENRGLPAARNTGMQVAKGEFIFHCDGDDFTEFTLLEELYNTAKEKNADYVWCDWSLSYQNTERYMRMPSFSSPFDALKCMLAGGMKYNVWNKLVKRSLYFDNKIQFPSGHSMGEDMTMIQVLACSSKTAYVNKALYHYVKTNSGAMTNNLKEQDLIDIKYNVKKTEFAITTSIYGNQIKKEIEWFKLNVKLPFLISQDKQLYHLWDTWYKESNKHIWSNKNIATRTRLLQQMAAWKQWWFVRAYFVVIYKLIYNLRYN